MQVATEALFDYVSQDLSVPRYCSDFTLRQRIQRRQIKAPEPYLDQLHHQVELCGGVHLLYEHDDVWVLHSAQNGHFILNQVLLFRRRWKFI